MKKDIQLLIEKLKHAHKQKQIWKGIACILSCIAIFVTINLLVTPAITLNEPTAYTFSLRDNYSFDWKSSVTTAYDLDLYFMDTNGNYIEGKDVTFEISANGHGDDPYGFGFIPYSDTTLKNFRGDNLISALEINRYTSSTGEIYEFDHAEVLVNDTWHRFNGESKRWHIWCQNASNSSLQTNYGWRGEYGPNNTSYTIDSNTKYKFVYKEVRYGVKDSVESLGTGSGISFNIFNYSGDNSNVGDNNVNNNGVYNYFTFRGIPGDNNVAGIINPTLDADGFIDSARIKVEPTLDVNKNPVFDCRNTNGCSNFSLGYLFGSGGPSTKGVTSYSANNTPLQINQDDGYYYYDSNANAVDYDTQNNRFMVRNYAERSTNMSSYPGESTRTEFMPFNYWNPNNSSAGTIKEYAANQVDHWFGMTMEFGFYMPEDGKMNDEDMIFSFSGDDDVWVFIDNVLVLDLGGTHGAVDGTINFATGDVESYLNWGGTNAKDDAIAAGLTKTETYTLTNIYQMYTNAGATGDIEWNEDNNTYKNYSYHTLKFFYLERGGSVSNCKIRFNIPVLPSGTVSVQKQFLGEDEYNENHEFTIYDVTNGGATPVPNASYTIGNNIYQTNENGKFTLQKDQVAIFVLNNFHTYYVEETTPGAHAEFYSCTLNDATCPSVNQTGEFTINPDSTHRVVFKNKIKTFDLNVSKTVYSSSSDETFEFKLYLSKNDLPIDILDDINDPQKYVVDHQNGVVTFNLKKDENVTIKDIPIDTLATLQEVKHDGYNVIIKSGDILLANGDTYQFTMDSDKNITVHNTPGVVLPETGGSGILWYLLIGISLIAISIKFGYKYIFNMKEGEV